MMVSGMDTSANSSLAVVPLKSGLIETRDINEIKRDCVLKELNFYKMKNVWLEIDIGKGCRDHSCVNMFGRYERKVAKLKLRKEASGKI